MVCIGGPSPPPPAPQGTASRRRGSRRPARGGDDGGSSGDNGSSAVLSLLPPFSLPPARCFPRHKPLKFSVAATRPLPPRRRRNDPRQRPPASTTPRLVTPHNTHRPPTIAAGQTHTRPMAQVRVSPRPPASPHSPHRASREAPGTAATPTAAATLALASPVAARRRRWRRRLTALSTRSGTAGRAPAPRWCRRHLHPGKSRYAPPPRGAPEHACQRTRSPHPRQRFRPGSPTMSAVAAPAPTR